MQTKLNNFIRDTLLVSGYSLSYKELTQDDIIKLQQLLAELSDNLTSGTDADKVRKVFDKMTKLLPSKYTEEEFSKIWREFWVLSNDVSDMAHIGWCDPDTTYEEDILARYYAIKRWLEDAEEG